MNKPFFSIVTPVYKIEKLIESTVKSLISQTFSDWEMICIDDGSPDESGKICDKYAESDARIRVIHKENEGLAQARNDGIENAKGEYIIILEGSDLLFDKSTLENIHTDLISSGNPDIYFALLEDMLEGTGKVTGIQKEYSINGLYSEGGQKLFCKLADSNDVLALSSPVNKAFKRQFLIDEKLSFCKGIYHDDDEFIPRAIAASKSSYFTDRIIYNAMDWADSFGRLKNENGLVRKNCDKMFLAGRCCKYFEDRYSDKQFLNKVYEYYMRIFLSGVLGYYDVEAVENKNQIFDFFRDNKKTLNYLKKSGVKNLRILNLCFKLFGLKTGMKILKQRYN